MQITIGVSLTLTLIDALLLQKTKSFFTGGFLASEFTSGPAEALGFVSLSALTDAGVVGVTVAIALWATSRVPLTRAARTLAVALIAIFPPLLVDFVNYRLFAYLGDAFDLSLMFELAGNRASELTAVALPHMLQLGALAVAGAIALFTVVWFANRMSQGSPPEVMGQGRLSSRALLLFVVAMGCSVSFSAWSETVADGLSRKPSGRMFETLTGKLTDFDRDGFGMVGRMRDVNPFNAASYPWAIDIPGNHVDENGAGGDLPANYSRYVETIMPPVPWSKPLPDVVLFVLESFRADAVGRTINGKPVTPILDALGREGVSSLHAYSHNGYTAQSRFHLLTGSLAGLRQGSLIDDFNANGYETAYFSAQDESFGGEGMSVGFERAEVAYDARQDRARRYSSFSTPGSLAVSLATVEERITSFLSNRDTRRPLFLYVNFHDTHYPYHHSEIEPLIASRVLRQAQIAPSRRDALQEMYFNTAANVDRAIGKVVDQVTKTQHRAPAVVVTADHGESLFDETFLGHGYALNEIQTRVPLIARGLALEITEPFGQSDLRDAMSAALAREISSGKVPRARQQAEKTVFQYLGNIQRPRQIGFLSASGRTIYDFRNRGVSTNGRTWRNPDSLAGEERVQYLALIHFWERVMIALRP